MRWQNGPYDSVLAWYSLYPVSYERLYLRPRLGVHYHANDDKTTYIPTAPMELIRLFIRHQNSHP